MKPLRRTPLVAALLALALPRPLPPKAAPKDPNSPRLAAAEAKHQRKNARRAAEHHGGRP